MLALVMMAPHLRVSASMKVLKAAGVPPPMIRPCFSMLKQGLIIGGGTPAAFKTFIEAETRKWGAIITKANIKLD